MYFKKVRYTVQKNIAWLENQDMTAIVLPTGRLIDSINVRLSGTPGGALNTPFLQNGLWPAVCNLLGKFTIQGTNRDGSQGIQMENISFGSQWLRAWMLKKTQPPATDIDVSSYGDPVDVTVPIIFQDPRLPLAQRFQTALEAQRFGGNNGSLTLQISTGTQIAATGLASDKVAVIDTGGFTTAPASLVIAVEVVQLIPVGRDWPDFRAPGAAPMLDLALEYRVLPGTPQTLSNDFPLLYKGLQAETYFLDCDRNSVGLETPINSLGVIPEAYLMEMVGTVQIQKMDPDQLQANDLMDYLPGASSWPVGVYVNNDWRNNLRSAQNYIKADASHTWNLNMDTTSNTDSILRMLHTTYNPSQAYKKLHRL